MKFSLQIRIALCLGIAIFIYATALRASLEDILAPLPEPEVSIQTASVAQKSPPPTRIETITTREPAAVSEPMEILDPILSIDLHEAIVEEMSQALRPNGKLSLVPMRELPLLSGYSRPFQVHLVNVPSRLSRGNVMVRFQVENEKGILGEWTVPFRTHLYSEVWVPKTHLRRGEIATPSDFEVGQVDLLLEPDAVPAALELLLRHEYSRDITPGKPLVWRDLMERSLVRKGDVVEVSASSGLLAITMRAVARQDGSEGDLIVLRNLDSAKEFSARVIAENRAEVVF